MAAESAADRLAFLDTTEFGISATYTLAAGGSSTVQGIFDKEFREVVENEFGVGVATHPAGFTMREADLPGGYGDGDTMLVNAVTYTIRAHELDGTGMVSLRLEKCPTSASKSATWPSPPSPG